MTSSLRAHEIAEHFGLGRGARLSDGPVARGREGFVWRLDTPDARWAVKVGLQAPSEADSAASAAVQEAAQARGVPTPAVRRTVLGLVLADVAGGPVRLQQWVDLLAPDDALDPEQVGAVVAATHRGAPPPTAGPLDPWYQAPVGAPRWDELVHLLSVAGAPFAHRLRDLRDELVALEGWLEPPRTLVTGHRDLWADNLRRTADGAICVLDWDNAGPCDPSHELGYVLFEYGRSDLGRARALVEAYRAAGGPGRVQRRGDFSVLIAELGHITELAAMDWLRPNPRSPDRRDSAAWISEVFDDPHTRSRLDALLAAVHDR